MINAVIIEKDLNYAKSLKLLLLQWAEKELPVNVLVFRNDRNNFHCSPEILSCDIVFISVSANQSNGFTIAETLREAGYQNTLIFISESPEKAAEGYKFSAYRYYIKPVLPCDIKECMDYALDKKAADYFQFTYRGRTERIAFDRIVCFESLLHYVEIHTRDETIRIKSTLKEVQEKCPSYFIRCQRSYIVNRNYIVSRKGNQIQMANRLIISVSPKCEKEIFGIMDKPISVPHE